VKKNANRLSTDGKWRSFPQVPHWPQYVSSGAPFARLKIKGIAQFSKLEFLNAGSSLGVEGIVAPSTAGLAVLGRILFGFSQAAKAISPGKGAGSWRIAANELRLVGKIPAPPAPISLVPPT
jgi:hypothetical protein